MTLNEMKAVLAQVQFNDWTFRVRLDGMRPYLQVEFYAADNVSGHWPGLKHKGRKWFLSAHMTKSEIVPTALKAALTAVEHEAREQFRYRGQAIFDPHYNVDHLVELRSREDALDERATERTELDHVHRF